MCAPHGWPRIASGLHATASACTTSGMFGLITRQREELATFRSEAVANLAQIQRATNGGRLQLSAINSVSEIGSARVARTPPSPLQSPQSLTCQLNPHRRGGERLWKHIDHARRRGRFWSHARRSGHVVAVCTRASRPLMA